MTYQRMLNNLPISLEDELADELDEMARDIALIEPDPMDWVGWVIYFLDQLEEEAKRRRRRCAFDSVLSVLVNEIHDRIKRE